jgi:transposase
LRDTALVRAITDLLTDLSDLVQKHLRPARAGRQLMEQLDYSLPFRWFVGLSANDPVWDATVCCKNRDRLLENDIEGRINA